MEGRTLRGPGFAAAIAEACIGAAEAEAGATDATCDCWLRPTNRATSARKPSHTLSVVSPCQCARSAVCVSSNMIGRSHASIMHGTSVRFRSASVASARTQRDSTDFFDHKTTTALASRRAFSVT